MSSIYESKKINFLPFLQFDFSLTDSIQDRGFYCALIINFGIFVLIALSIFRKNNLYREQGFLKVEKSELKNMLEDKKQQVEKNIQVEGHKMRKLPSLLFEEDCLLEQNKNCSKINSKCYSKNQRNSSKKKKTKEGDQKPNIMNKIVDISFSQSISERKRQEEIDEREKLAKRNEDILEGEKRENREIPGNNEEIVVNLQDDPDQINQNHTRKLEKKHSIAGSFCSMNQSNHFPSTVDYSQITNTINASCIIPPNQSSKLIEYSPSNNSFIINFEENKESSAAKENSSNKSQDIVEVNNEQSDQQSLKKQRPFIYQIRIANSNDNSNQQEYQLNQKSLKNNIIHSEEITKGKQSNAQEKENNSTLRIGSFYGEFKKEFLRLFRRHNLLINTWQEDSVLFPRVLKLITIHFNFSLLFLGGTFVQIYFCNQELSHQIQQIQRNPNAILPPLSPSDNILQLFREITLNIYAVFGLLLISLALAVFSKVDAEILFINNSNSTLERNLKEIKSNQQFKLILIGVVTIIISVFCFLQLYSFIKVIPLEFAIRWAIIGSSIFLFVHLIFDVLYFSFLSFLCCKKSQNQQKYLKLYAFLLIKVSWWAL